MCADQPRVDGVNSAEDSVAAMDAAAMATKATAMEAKGLRWRRLEAVEAAVVKAEAMMWRWRRWMRR